MAGANPTAIVASGRMVTDASACTLMQVSRQRELKGVTVPRISSGQPMADGPLAKSVQVHGCHRYYAHDMSGWHRHDKECRTLRGVVGRKSRNPAKS